MSNTSSPTKTGDPITVLEALAHEAGLGAADSEAMETPEERDSIDRLLALARRELAKHARADALAAERELRPVRASILAMTRDAVIARLRELGMLPLGALAVSHRNRNGFAQSDDDLRGLLEDLEAVNESGAEP